MARAIVTLHMTADEAMSLIKVDEGDKFVASIEFKKTDNSGRDWTPIPDPIQVSVEKVEIIP